MGGGSGGGRRSIILYLCLFSPLRSDQQRARRAELSEQSQYYVIKYLYFTFPFPFHTNSFYFGYKLLLRLKLFVSSPSSETFSEYQ